MFKLFCIMCIAIAVFILCQLHLFYRIYEYEIDSCYSCFSVLTKILSGDSVIPELGAKFVALIIFDIRGTYREERIESRNRNNCKYFVYNLHL
uniref:Adenylate/guanylate cyclase domain-containing protein n=1 Tax=Heterorhabditis bacteriophora TaxID=37862 RepID=A0A1I7WLR3_HETBA